MHAVARVLARTESHLQTADIHAAVYVCMYTYNLTIHVTMYIFFLLTEREREGGWREVESVWGTGRICEGEEEQEGLMERVCAMNKRRMYIYCVRV